ncbi:MAG: cell division protein ZapE [Pseudomonadota bacterium]
MTGVLHDYEARVAEGLLMRDGAQVRAAEQLDALGQRLAGAAAASSGWFSKKTKAVQGLYMWGGVGRGKSMLMDMFLEHAPAETKWRVHFHAFMATVHRRLDAWRSMSPAERKRAPNRVKGGGDDPIAPVAKAIAEQASLLCFDEFQVTQIADAMILSRLFEQLFSRGVTVVATSNRHPRDLYKDGINRQLFLPFIDRLMEHCLVHELASDEDYRLKHLSTARVWHSPLGAGADGAMDAAWNRLTLGATPEAGALKVQGRTLDVERQAAGVARMTFEALCARPLGPSDYLALASAYHTLMLDRVPTLSPSNRNEAIRFTNLIDALYEAKVKLVASAAAEPDDLYPSGDGSFEFQRTASRLHEMRSEAYLAAEHIVTAETV